MRVKAKILKVEPMQSFRYGANKEHEMRTQALLLQVGSELGDQLWAERRAPLLDAYDGSEFDTRLYYDVLLRARASQFTNGEGRSFYRNEYEILHLDLAR